MKIYRRKAKSVMEPASEMPKRKGTIKFFFVVTNEWNFKNRIYNIFLFLSSEFFCELLYLRKNARTVVREHTNIRAFHSPGNSFGCHVMVAWDRGEKPVEHEQWEYQNYRGAPARTTNGPLILWAAHRAVNFHRSRGSKNAMGNRSMRSYESHSRNNKCIVWLLP